jgi:multidrug resistance efflux pump
VSQLEEQIRELRAEGAAYEAAVQRKKARAKTDAAEIRRRWYLAEDDGGYSMSTKRTMLREAFHAVIVHPVGQGRGSRTKFDPDKLEPVWREE